MGHHWSGLIHLAGGFRSPQKTGRLRAPRSFIHSHSSSAPHSPIRTLCESVNVGSQTLPLLRRPYIARRAPRRGNVALGAVVHDHAVRVEPPPQGANGPLHPLDPATGEPVAIALVIKRNHLVPQHPVEVLAVALVVYFQVGVDPPVADGEPVQPIVGL